MKLFKGMLAGAAMAIGLAFSTATAQAEELVVATDTAFVPF